MTPEQDRANKATALLRDPLLLGAFASFEKDIWEKIKNSTPEQHHLREHLYCMIKGLESVAVGLKAHIDNFKVASQPRRSSQP